MSDIDFTGAQALAELAVELRERHIQLGIARSSHFVHHELKHSGVLAEIGPDHVFPAVQEAVDALSPER
jgi:MFS superfamily sulfate permease-like transporter